MQGPVSAEVIAQDVEGMVREGRLLARVHEHVIVKVPLTTAGLAATLIALGLVPINLYLFGRASRDPLAIASAKIFDNGPNFAYNRAHI